LRTIMSNHGAKNIGDARAAYGITDGNPIWEEMRDIALRVGPSFLLNVALNAQRRITGVFAGDLIAAHKVGTEFVRRSTMQRVDAPFDIVVTTNSGYPLDLNLYQGVKGMGAGARIVRQGGTLILAAECREGVPARSAMDTLLRSAASPAELPAMLTSASEVRPEQWQAQIQALVQSKASALVHSSMTDDAVRAHLIPCADISGEVNRRLAALGAEARVAVLPHGPLTIPYVAQ
jgi:nickel-dependent lactate racemase